MRHVLNRVGAHQKEEYRGRNFFAELAERVDGVAPAATLDFDLVNSPTGLAQDRQLEHFEPLAVAGVRSFLLERLDGSRREPDFIERGLALARVGQSQVAVVHRIETTAEYAETHGKSRDESGESRAKKSKGWGSRARHCIVSRRSDCDQHF